MAEKEITKFEKKLCFKTKSLSSKVSIKFSDLQKKKAYSPRLQKSIIGLENRIERIKKVLYNN